MKIKSQAEIEMLRKIYPKGTKIILDHMDDMQAPPTGTHGTVIHVDDIGQIHVKWETGSGLALIPDEDQFHKGGIH